MEGCREATAAAAGSRPLTVSDAEPTDRRDTTALKTNRFDSSSSSSSPLTSTSR